MRGEYTKRKLNNVKKWILERPYYIRRSWNRMRIKERDFTIISNNCWAGKVYQYLGMPYLTPTVGLYFFAEDYIKFVSNLKYYLSLELRFITALDSRYREVLQERKHDMVPIAVLDDVRSGRIEFFAPTGNTYGNLFIIAFNGKLNLAARGVVCVLTDLFAFKLCGTVYVVMNVKSIFVFSVKEISDRIYVS